MQTGYCHLIALVPILRKHTVTKIGISQAQEEDKLRAYLMTSRLQQANAEGEKRLLQELHRPRLCSRIDPAALLAFAGG